MSYDATALAELIRNKEVSPKELAEAAFMRLEVVNPKLNAVVLTIRGKVVSKQPGG